MPAPKYSVYYLKNHQQKIIYVGNTTRSLEMRLQEHKPRKNLSNISIHKICEVASKQEAAVMETQFIDKFNTQLEGLNITKGYGRKGLGANKTSFKKDNLEGKKGTKQVRCLDTGIVYESLTDCAKSLGLNITRLSAVCRGENKKHKGMKFEFVQQKRG